MLVQEYLSDDECAALQQALLVNPEAGEMDLLDAQGQPTGVDFGPGEWTLESSNPAVFPSYTSSGRSAVLNPLGPGQTQRTLRPKRSGLTGSSAPLTVITPGAQAPATTEYVAPPPVVADVPSPGGTAGRVAAGIDFGDPAEPSRPSARISTIVTARRVVAGEAVDITDRFMPDINPIHVWFRLAGFAPGALLTSRWTYLGGATPLVIGTGEFRTGAASDYGTFSYELAPGKRWPAGESEVAILFHDALLGSATFVVRPAAGRD